MSAVEVIAGVLPIAGDQVTVTPRVAPLAITEDTLTVEWAELSDVPGWATLVGHWSNGQPGRVSFWFAQAVVRRPRHPCQPSSAAETPTASL